MRWPGSPAHEAFVDLGIARKPVAAMMSRTIATGEKGTVRMTTPIFIMGVAPRCGTNYLEDLLCVYPDCGLGVPLRENQLLDKLPDLAAIVESLEVSWQQREHWGFLPEHSSDLARSLGSALADFTISQVDERRRIEIPPATLPGIEQSFKKSPRYLITKHPRTTGLANFRQFLPDAKLILLMRDGRAVAESSMQSWGWHFDVAVDNWRRGARNIDRFLDTHPNDPSLLVRYEDLVTRPEEELAQVFDYLGLDPKQFDFERALGRPVRGSSVARPQGESVTWQPVEKTDAFDPLSRAREWTGAQHARFNRMAGELAERFGYPLEPVEETTFATIKHIGSDSLLTVRRATGPLRRRIRRAMRR